MSPLEFVKMRGLTPDEILATVKDGDRVHCEAIQFEAAGWVAERDQVSGLLRVIVLANCCRFVDYWVDPVAVRAVEKMEPSEYKDAALALISAARQLTGTSDRTMGAVEAFALAAVSREDWPLEDVDREEVSPC